MIIIDLPLHPHIELITDITSKKKKIVTKTEKLGFSLSCLRPPCCKLKTVLWFTSIIRLLLNEMVNIPRYYIYILGF